MESLQPPPPGLGLGTYFLQQKKLEAQAQRALFEIVMNESHEKLDDGAKHTADSAAAERDGWGARWDSGIVGDTYRYWRSTS